MKRRSALSQAGPKDVALSRREALRRAAGAGALISLTGLAGFRASTVEAAEESLGKFPKHPKWKFVFVNHVTTNPFFVPTRYGAEDACALLGCTYQWTGSEKSLAAGIPTVSYNADAKGNKRLCYIGQDLFESGRQLGQKIVDLVGEGDVAGFIATPGQLNIQPRMDGAREAIKESGKNIKLDEIATGPTVNEELSRIQAYYTGHPDIKGMFAVDAGSTQGVGQTMAANKLHDKGVHAGGFDLLPTTLDAISKGDLDFTIDQQPYLQGF